MQIDVTGQHLDVTPALRDYITGKLERLERHFDKVTNVHAVLSVEKLRQKAEATINVNGTSLHANAEDGDMYAAIDALVDKLDRQIKKHKEKITNHHRSEGSLKKIPLAEE
ncbi:MAG TPA: ribosome-associated translation inhibitor RaiA [Chromatiales bacterium]|nr:ribosome-associated translation inhibitor RaiA [Chromatiales bacterium]HEX23110.1 ribosome-associated translation inhibitor RaiA [Chromatiales bacterium]